MSQKIPNTLKFKCDLKVDNLNEYFAFQMKLMTLGQKENIPPELINKVFRQDGRITTKNLNFLQQMYLLSKGMGKDIYVLIKDQYKDVGITEFSHLSKTGVNREYSLEDAENLVAKGMIVLSGKELIEWATFMNGLSTSSAYNYALKVKNTHSSKLPEKMKELTYLVKILMNYESNKRRIVTHKGISVPELYVLYYLFDEKEKGAPESYTTIFKDAYNSSKNQMLRAFKKLSESGHIQTYGKARATTYKITAIGKTAIAEMLQKYVLD